MEIHALLGKRAKKKALVNSSSRFKQVSYEDRPHWRINTNQATIFVDRQSGGLSRLIDLDQNDWIGFKIEPWDQYPASAASAYRGMPNLVFGGEDSGVGHPGFNTCQSTIQDGRIYVESNSEKWKWNWTFDDRYMLLQVTDVDPDQPYWFLYEGAIAGTYDPDSHYWGTDVDRVPRHTIPDHYKGTKSFGKWQWLYMGDAHNDRVLFIYQMTKDNKPDLYSYLGNTKAGAISSDGMVVLGLGRADGAKPLLDQPNQFIIGFYEKPIQTASDHRVFRKYLKKLVKQVKRAHR